MYIFKLLDKISEFNDKFNRFINGIINTGNINEDENIDNTELNTESIVKINNDSIEISKELNDKLDLYLNQINMHNSIQNSIRDNTDNIHLNIVNDISEVYQFNNLLSYGSQLFIKDGEKVQYLEKINIDDKDMILFNTMISSKYPSNKVVFYSTTLENGVFKNRIIPAIVHNGWYYISVKIELVKIDDMSTSDINTYDIIDKNGYITAIAYI